MTFVIYAQQPTFPATDQNPNCVRYQVGNRWVDTDNPAPPTQADIDAIYAPGIAEAARKSGLSGDANFTALLTQAKTATNAQIDTWLTNNVTTLPQARTVLGALIKIVAVRVL